MLGRVAAAAGICLLVFGVAHVRAQSLKGSRTAMKRQNSIAQEENYTFLATGADVRSFVAKGLLVPVRGDANYKVDDVSYPYARPAIKLFVERLAPQYRSYCGEKLVVTSLTRPLSRQPWNAHELSVHPAGMALDLRVPRKSGCRNWLENTLKSLENRKVLEATRERRPAHYHVAVFPDQYERYVANLTGDTKLASAGKPKTTTTTNPQPKIAKVNGGASYASIIPVGGSSSQKSSGAVQYKVKKGDSLWSIARSHDVTVAELKRANGIRRSTIKAGELLEIPGASRATAG